MAVSSIHFELAKTGGLAHMMREHKREPRYLLEHGSRQQNEYWQDATDARQMYDQQIARLASRRGKRPRFDHCVWEGVLNLESRHDLNDVFVVASRIESLTHAKCLAIALHRDEGYKGKDGATHYNYHAHLQFVTYRADEPDGLPKQQWREKRISKIMPQIQTEIAKILGMERGKSGSKAVHLDHKEYRQEAAKREQMRERVESKDKTMRKAIHKASDALAAQEKAEADAKAARLEAKRITSELKRSSQSEADLQQKIMQLKIGNETAVQQTVEKYEESIRAMEEEFQKRLDEEIAKAAEKAAHDAETRERDEAEKRYGKYLKRISDLQAKLHALGERVRKLEDENARLKDGLEAKRKAEERSSVEAGADAIEDADMGILNEMLNGDAKADAPAPAPAAASYAAGAEFVHRPRQLVIPSPDVRAQLEALGYKPMPVERAYQRDVFNVPCDELAQVLKRAGVRGCVFYGGIGDARIGRAMDAGAACKRLGIRTVSETIAEAFNRGMGR